MILVSNSPILDVLLVTLKFDTIVILEHTDEITQATHVSDVSFLSTAKRSEVLDGCERHKAGGAEKAVSEEYTREMQRED